MSTTCLRATVLITLFVLFGCADSRRENIIIKRDKAEINYRDTGDGGATLLFVHGLGIDQTYWDSQVKYFGEDYRVVTLDLPGHGQSGKDRPHWSVRGYAGDIYTLIKRLDLKNVILIGHSLGGDINLVAATYRPKNIIGFIGIDNFKNAGMPVPVKMKPAVDGFLQNLKKDFQPAMTTFVRSALVSDSTPVEISNRVANNFSRVYKPMFLEIMPSVFELYREEQRLMPQLKMKMHLINVDNTPTNTAALEKLLPQGYDLKELHGTSHYPMLESPDELNILLRQTIEEISREHDNARKPI